MVWFQCEDCGENVKKPKLANHCRCCSARKLSCIDCGVVFNQQSVQGHTQCVSEAEKYGPKTGRLIKKETAKACNQENNCDALDCSVGLSVRAPWGCSLCNVKATSQETLLLHSQGKKHQSKVRGQSFKLSNSTDILNTNAKEEERKVAVNGLVEMVQLTSNDKNGLNQDYIHKSEKELQPADASHRDELVSNSEPREGMMKEQIKERKSKRKLPSDANTPDDVKSNKCGVEMSTRKQKTVSAVDGMEETWMALIKWKKLIKKALKNAPTGSLKFKELQSLILPSVLDFAKRSDLDIDLAIFSKALQRRIKSSSKYIIDGKKVSLAV